MRVLVVGAGGRFGQRVVVALLSHGHSVVAYVRTPSKLAEELPATVMSRITVVQGDAEDVVAMKAAITDNKCDAVVNCAGFISPPWSAPTRLAEITIAVAQAAREVGEESGKPLRCWLLAGIICMDMPGEYGKTYLDYYPFHLEYKKSDPVIREIPTSSLRWSLLCPSGLSALHKDGKTHDLDAPLGNNLVFGADRPPLAEKSWLSWIPFIGFYLDIFRQMGGAMTTHEELADRLAEDLAQPDEGERWVGHFVGLKPVKDTKVKAV